MARVSSKYNYRIRKTKKKKKETVGKLENSDKVLKLKRKDRKEKIILSRKKKEDKIKDGYPRNNKKSPAVRKSKIVKKASRRATLDELKEYFFDKTVLVVGNSSEVTTKRLGKKIDSYDVVIRLNFGLPIKKYLIHMGEKINIWGHGIKSHKSQISLHRRCMPDIDYHIETNDKKACASISNYEKAFVIPRKWYKLEYDRRTGFEMSTGLNMIKFLVDYIKTMKSLSIVGFDFLKTKNHVLRSSKAMYHDSDCEEKEVKKILNSCDFYIPFSDKYNFAK